MDAAAAASLAPPIAIPVPRVPAWAWAVVAIATATMYAVTLENGAVLGELAGRLHEFLHDGRHFSAVPCH